MQPLHNPLKSVVRPVLLFGVAVPVVYIAPTLLEGTINTGLL